MKFYEIDNALQEAIVAADTPVRVDIKIDRGDHILHVFENDIVEANFFGINEAAGGTSSRGEVLLDNRYGIYSRSNTAGAEVTISFTVGIGLSYFKRFIFYIDDKGFQEVRGSGRKRFVYFNLQDLSAKLRKTDETRDWTSSAVFTYSVVCDKAQPKKSLVHGIAKRAGLDVTDIDCSTIPITFPFIRLKRSVWSELSSLATACRCHLECAPEKPLVFAHSPYQSEWQDEEKYSYTFSGEDIFYLRKISRADIYRNSVRLKINIPVTLEKQEIWHYNEPPVFYDEFLQEHYPFKFPLIREIENGKYEAKYKIIDVDGKERNVIFADEIDTKEEAENRLEYDGGPFMYSHYDITANYDRALITLQKENDGDLYRASIYGRPIVLDLNRSCFLTDSEAVKKYGTAALNVTGSYFSEYEINGRPHYEDWVARELAERLLTKREFTVKTHRALFNARVGAKVKIQVNREQGKGNSEELTGKINAFSFRYKRDKAFVAAFKIKEE